MHQYPQHEPTPVGGRLLDAANPGDNVQPARCVVCHGTRDLTQVSAPPAGPATTTICTPHLEAAMRSLGPATVSEINTCSKPHPGNAPMLYGVVQVWPLRTVHDTRQPSIRACPVHLAEAVTAQAAAHTTPETS